MNIFSAAALGFKTLSDGLKPSDNVGSDQNGVSRFGRSRVRSESEGHTTRSEKRRVGEDGGSQPNSEKGESLSNSAHDIQLSPVGGDWMSKHASALRERATRARLASQSDGKAWTLHADRQTRNILDDCPKRDISNETAEKYRRAYDNLRASGKTALEAASTRAHWDFLRTATRYCLEQDTRAWRAASEVARKAGQLEKAQYCTEQAFNMAAVLDEQFMQPHRKTWTHKAAKLKEQGIRPVSKSKRSTRAPSPNLATVALIAGNKKGTKLVERHAERLAVLSLFGVRPAELKKGIKLKVTEDGKYLTAEVLGAKCSDAHNRGQEVRVIRVPVKGSAAQALAEEVAKHGKAWKMQTSDADYRSLNRGLASSGLSCYSFRHQVGSELKEAVSTGAMTAAEAAKTMGHRSTESLSYYGSRSKSGGGRTMQANATNEVRVEPVSFAARAEARAKTGNGRIRVTPTPQARPRAVPKAARARSAAPRPKPPRIM
ncbi:hypothetical protein [Xanthomonas euvesicatoria]|uniref:hypothetical protein n=1 Tax=Xanthomonas euvesicatoria TaxID=456327 RepID=UPI0012D74E5D|nr:hypothetical protein [Xanthomonas euvesicatoria]